MDERKKIYEFAINSQLPRVFEFVNALIAAEPSVTSYHKGRPEAWK